jgi:hypothetical protein
MQPWGVVLLRFRRLAGLGGGCFVPSSHDCNCLRGHARLFCKTSCGNAVAGMFVDENVGGPISKHRAAPHPIPALAGCLTSTRDHWLVWWRAWFALDGALFSALPVVPQKRTGERGR